jgi:hypothetical protein
MNVLLWINYHIKKWAFIIVFDYVGRVFEVVIINSVSIPIKKGTEFLSDCFLSFWRFNFIWGNDGKNIEDKNLLDLRIESSRV